MTREVHEGDSAEVLRGFAEASIDAVVLAPEARFWYTDTVPARTDPEDALSVYANPIAPAASRALPVSLPGQEALTAGASAYVEGDTMTRECPVCGKAYEADPKRLKWGRQTTCSRECSYRLRATKTSASTAFTCPICGKEFQRSPAQLEKVHRGQPACSRPCAYKARALWGPPKQYQLVAAPYAGGKVRLHCIACGKSFLRLPSQVRRGSTKYCSQACFMADRNYQRGEDNPSWRGGHRAYYGPDWRPAQRAVRSRDGDECARCGISSAEAGRELDVHHLQPFGSFADPDEANALDNLVALCHPCHMWVEWNGVDFPIRTGEAAECIA